MLKRLLLAKTSSDIFMIIMRMEVIFSKIRLQIWCLQYKSNIYHVDFTEQKPKDINNRVKSKKMSYFYNFLPEQRNFAFY